LTLLDLVGVLTLPSTSPLKKVVAADKMVGFAAGEIRKNEMLGWITTIALPKATVALDWGGALLRASEADMKMPRVCLCVRKSNHPAIALYNSEGYNAIDLWEHYYQDGEAAIIMEKQLRKGTLQRMAASG